MLWDDYLLNIRGPERSSEPLLTTSECRVTSEQGDENPLWVAEVGPNHGFSRIFKSFPKILIFVEK